MNFFEIEMGNFVAAAKEVQRGLTKKEAKKLSKEVYAGAYYRYGLGKNKWAVMEGVTDNR